MIKKIFLLAVLIIPCIGFAKASSHMSNQNEYACVEDSLGIPQQELEPSMKMPIPIALFLNAIQDAYPSMDNVSFEDFVLTMKVGDKVFALSLVAYRRLEEEGDEASIRLVVTSDLDGTVYDKVHVVLLAKNDPPFNVVLSMDELQRLIIRLQQVEA